MIKKENFKNTLVKLAFEKSGDVYIKKFKELNTELKVDFTKQELIYPEKDGLTVNDKTTSNFSSNENFVVFECVHRLLSQGYHPKHIELEKEWQLGHTGKSGKADVFITDNAGQSLLIIECKTAGAEYTKAIKILENDARNQLFSYLQQATSTKFLALYASDFVDGEVKEDYYLINVQDNEKLLENAPELKSFKDATTFEEKYAVWRDTYKKDYATIGIFEDNKAYDIGKSKYSLKDLKTVSSKDIQGKYHEFATIMRQHNVSGRENAFDKLVNLFLCKVVDEANNADELKFYWKGVAYDDPFSLQDRLNHLYKVGMKKFLGEDITYIENAQIDDAFSVFADKPNMTKEIIQGFFKELKFFTNNDFAFVDVHNEDLFHQNFEVLLKIVKMLQDIKLTGSEDNQFLGDMFEGFLDQGVKQSEGQFFTPMPIVKFIINSLPIEDIQKIQDNPKAIDYACGAGHFLNEVANNFEKQHHKNIVGIEKEYRLSKVAKVSSFMYGQDDIQIVYHDALAKPKDVKDDDYSILVANPPYSVKGFLETLNEKERNAYELIHAIEEKTFSASNSIECFFIERAKQLLKKDGVAGIVLPSSILSKGSQNIASTKGNIYVQTREILLKYFDIIAIAEFGSGTFGKTGTNTVTLFLKRKADNPDIAKHLDYMVESWFEGDFSTNELFKDKDLLKDYALHIEIDLELYKTVLKNSYDETLFKVEMFSEYKQEFEKLSETKNRKKQKYYKALSAEEKEKREQIELLDYVRLIEQDKLYYFSLAYLNQKEVLIIKAPSDGAKNKKFLGYEWSGRKGDEGIKYITSGKALKVEGEDAETLENILNLNNIQTPLYNPQDKLDQSKINTLIAKNFSDKVVEIPQVLEAFVSKAKLVDMLDFSRKEFSKAFSLSPRITVKIETRWSLVKIEDVSKINTTSINPLDKPNDKFIYVDIDSLEKNSGKINFNNQIIGKSAPSRAKRIALKESTIISTVRPNLKGFAYLEEEKQNTVYSTGFAILESKDTNILLPKLIYYFFMYYDSLMEQMKSVMGKASYPSINKNDIGNFKIPLPPLDIQKEIIKACEVVDSEVQKANKTIEKAENEISNEIKKITGEEVKLGDITENLSNLRVPITQRNRIKGDIPYYGASGIVDYVSDYIIDDYVLLVSEDGANLKTRNTPIAFTVVGKAWVNNHAHILKFENKNTHILVEYILNHMNLDRFITGQAQPKLNQSNLKEIKFQLPILEVQKEIVSKIQKLEDKITKAKTTIEGSSEKKQTILKKYLT